MINVDSYETKAGKYSVLSSKALRAHDIAVSVNETSVEFSKPKPVGYWRFASAQENLLDQRNKKETSLKKDSVLVLALDENANEFLRTLAKTVDQLSTVDGENLIYSVLTPRELLRNAAVETAVAAPALANREFVPPEDAPQRYRLNWEDWLKYAPYAVVALMSIVAGIGIDRFFSRAPASTGGTATNPVPRNQTAAQEQKTDAVPNDAPWWRIQKEWQTTERNGKTQFRLATTHAFTTWKESRERFALAAIKAALVSAGSQAVMGELERPGSVTKTTNEVVKYSTKIDPGIRTFAAAVLCESPEDTELTKDDRDGLRDALKPAGACNSVEPTAEQTKAAIDAVKALNLPKN